ncbi:MAG: sulfatase-like hydrolase/transferase [Verrucomicrobia bacterium]|nr:sulfatase-like hydrolase/transferase [Verrucomicrobiota bacterium]
MAIMNIFIHTAVLGLALLNLQAPSAQGDNTDVIIDNARLEKDAFKFNFLGQWCKRYYVQSSTNLDQWAPVSTHSVAKPYERIEFVDMNTDTHGSRFYRLAERSIPLSRKPNIIFIMTDDQGPWAFGKSGNPNAVTPNLDKLSDEGAWLPNSFVSTPVCSPSRASLLTSRYGTELGITDWIHPSVEPELGLDPDTITWPEVLQDAGYVNGLVGKWHVGTKDRFHPTNTEYDFFMGFRGGATSVKDPSLELEGETSKFEGYTTDILTDYALQFITNNLDRPFMLSVHYRAPHAPWLPVPDDDWAPFENLDPQIPNPDYPKLDIPRVENMTREYLASVKGVDRNIGRILETINSYGVSDNTILIFTSDHGYNVGHNGIWHKGNGHWILTDPPPATPNIPLWQRPNMYDNSLKTPTIIRWPGVIEPGTVITQSVCNLDWYPTVLHMAGVDAPANTIIRGRNIVPLLVDQSIPWDNNFYAEYSTHHQSTTAMRMYRTPEWKLVRDFINPERDELYNLASDPNETSNLINRNSTEIKEVIATLHDKIIEKMEETGDPMLQFLNDETPPALLEAEANGTGRGVILSFSENLASDTSTNTHNYNIRPELEVMNATFMNGYSNVLLLTQEQTPETRYLVTVSNVTDSSPAANVIGESNSAYFTAWVKKNGALRMDAFHNIEGTSLAALKSDPRYPDKPDSVSLVTEFEIPTNAANDYGVVVNGFLTPKTTADYIFYICADDEAELYLSADETAQIFKRIAWENAWHRPRTWFSTERRSVIDAGTPDERYNNQSKPIHLVAGERYAVRALVKDGGGGDNLAVTWQVSGEPKPENGAAPITSEFLSTSMKP